MKNLTKLTALLLSFMILLSGCSFLDRPDQTGLPFTFELAYDSKYEFIRHGRLVYTITKFWVVDNVAEIPEEGGFREDTASICITDEDGMGVPYHYPDEIVMEDGSFIGGTYMVMVEFAVTSEDAEAWTCNDYREGAKEAGKGPRGPYEDPYIFSPEKVMGAFFENGLSVSSNITYFSAYDEFPESRQCIFRLEPGETRTLVVGCFINIDAGEVPDVNDLFFEVRNNGSQVFVPVKVNLTADEAN